MKQVLDDSYRQDSLLDPEDLINLDETLYDVKQEELIGRDILPLKQDVPVWAESHEFKKYQAGEGEPDTVYHVGDDLPNVQIDERARHSINIFEIALSYNISKKELQAAQATGVALENENVRVLRRKFAEYENNIIFKGEGSVNASGLCDYGVEYTDTETWDDAEAIFEDLNNFATEFESQTGNWTPRSLILTKQAAKTMKTTYFYGTANAASPGRTVWSHIQDADLFGTIYITDQIESKGEMMILDNTPENMALVLPQDMQRLEPRDEGLYFEVPVWQRLGEILVRYDENEYEEDDYSAIMYAEPSYT